LRVGRNAIRWLSVLAAGAAVVALAVPASAMPAGPSWGKAQQVVTPATRAKSEGGIKSVSCAPGGYCAAGGFYQTSAGKWAAYVVTGTNGDWGKISLINVSGLRQTVPPSPATLKVSCPSAGNCVAVGTYADLNNAEQPFVVSEKNGTWGKAQAVPGLKTVSGDLDAVVFSLACASPGNCVVGGQYQNSTESQSEQPWAAAEKNGVWGEAEDVPGTAKLNIVQGNVTSISCTTGGTCLGVGSYQVGESTVQFVITESKGTWSTAQTIPDLPAGGYLSLASCSTDGSCTVAGGVSAGQNSEQLFTILRKNGTWGAVNDIRGTKAFDGGLVSLSCYMRGYCTSAGAYNDAARHVQSFVAVERSGYWHPAENLPGIGRLSHGKDFAAQVTGLSCPNTYNCAVTGWANIYVTPTVVRTEGIVASLINGVWHWAEVIPGITALDGNGNSEAVSVACSKPDHCTAGGSYELAGSTSPLAFLVNQGA
jgi:hypothetical protein